MTRKPYRRGNSAWCDELDPECKPLAFLLASGIELETSNMESLKFKPLVHPEGLMVQIH